MFVSRLADVRPHTSGWVRWTLPSGRQIEVTKLPLWDRENLVFARLTYELASQVAQREHARLLHVAEVDDIFARGYRTAPVMLPPTNEMMSLEWARRHDQRVLPQLAGWNGKSPVANVGKDYIAGAPAGKQRYYGWFLAPGKPLQPDWVNAHNSKYSDYSQLTRLARDVAPGAVDLTDVDRTLDAHDPGDPDGRGLSGLQMVILVGALVAGGIWAANHLGDR